MRPKIKNTDEYRRKKNKICTQFQESNLINAINLQSVRSKLTAISLSIQNLISQNTVILFNTLLKQSQMFLQYSYLKHLEFIRSIISKIYYYNDYILINYVFSKTPVNVYVR